jgi:NAD(P)-dependent dehydrogenase (short-subunit alcohol dehydrogenase family)
MAYDTGESLQFERWWVDSSNERGMAMISEQLSLAGKTAIVTGSGRGLGRAMALAMAEAGADLVITARTPREIEFTGTEVEKLGCRALVTPCDVTKTHDVEAMVAKAIDAFGGIDILINNAGGGRSNPVLEMTDEEWHWGIDINLTSTFLCSRAVGRTMAMRGRGKVINIASGWGYRGRRNGTAYCASKAAVINFTRALAVEWSRYNIQVNCIAPGYFPLIAPKDAEEARQRAARISRIPLGGGNPEDIGPLAVFLASDGAGYLTGQTILLDGGALLP